MKRPRFAAATDVVVALSVVVLSACAEGEGPSDDDEVAKVAEAVVTPIGLSEAECPDLGSCTANDVVTTVVDAQEINGDDCTDGFLDVQWTFEFESTATARYDLGVFVGTDGVVLADSESCLGVAPQAGDGDGDSDPDADGDLFQRLDPHGVLDTCGDLSTAQGPVQLTVSATVSCNDVTATGELTVPSCRVWQQNANHKGACTDLAAAGTGSKCDCDPVTLHVDPCSLIVCDNGLYCDGTETCDSSSGVAVCSAETAPNCDDGVGCTDDSCNETTDRCDNTSNNATCDDGLYCNGAETCDPANDCQAGTAITCGDDGASCTTEVCNESTDSCDTSDNGGCAQLAPAGSGCSCVCVTPPA